MPITVDFLAIVIMEAYAIVFFLLAVFFLNLSRRIGGKITALKQVLDEKPKDRKTGSSSSYSFNWLMSNTRQSKGLIWSLVRSIREASFPRLFITLIGIFALFWFFVVAILITFFYAGYALFLALIGATIFLGTDAFEARRYAKAIQEVDVEELVEVDQDYMEITKETFNSATKKFLIVGLIFSLVGPFIPQLFDFLVYALLVYMSVFFQAVDVSLGISRVMAVLIILFLPVLLLYLLEVISRTLLQKMKNNLET